MTFCQPCSTICSFGRQMTTAGWAVATHTYWRGQDGKWDDEVYFEYEYVRGIRTAEWKYVERTPEWPSELFDLVNDPQERRNVLSYPQHADRVKQFRARVHRFFEQAGAPPAADWQSTTTQKLAVYE